MDEYLSTNENSFPSSIGTIALYGHSSTAYHLARLFSSVGVQVYLIASEENIEIPFLSRHVTLLNEKDDLPYLSSVLINCQNNFLSIQTFLNTLPNDYKQRMAYVECSSLMRENQLEMLYEQMQFTHYLCMNLIELETSTMIQPHIHLLCSGDEIVFQKLLLQTHLPVKMTFLNQTKTPFDSFYLCLLHRYSQAIHLAIYAEMMAIFKAANEIYPGNLQFLFDWSYIKRPLMRQIILQSASSSFTFTTINDFQLLLECIIEHFFNENEENHLKALTRKLYQFISNLDRKLKDKPIFELFTLY